MIRTSIEISRQHGQPPSWWDGLSRADRVLLLADRAEAAAEQERANRRAEVEARKREAEARRGRR
jgi:hypothetical protein